MLPVMHMLPVMLYAAYDALYLCEHMPLPVMRFRKLSICHFFVIFVRIQFDPLAESGICIHVISYVLASWNNLIMYWLSVLKLEGLGEAVP